MDRPEAEYQYFFCSCCGVQLRSKPAQAGRQFPCPKCGSILLVPHSERTERRGGSPAGVEMYDIREVENNVRPTLPPLQHSGPPQAVAGKAVEPKPTKISNRPKPPPRPLLRGVLSFLPQPNAIIYWSVLSIMGTLLFSLLLAALALGNTPSPVTWMGSAIFSAFTSVVGMIFIIFNAICCLTILQESAAGNRVIEDWPGTAIFDLIGESFFLINSVLISMAAAWLATYPLAGLETLRAFCLFVIMVILFPIMLLSMLESESCLLPASVAVWQSLRRSLRTWLVFYLESFALAFAFYCYLTLLAFVVVRYTSEMTLGLVLFTVALGVGLGILLEMIYFRLMGRLAWVCDEDSRRELAEKEAAEEEEQESRETAEIRPTPVDDF